LTREYEYVRQELQGVRQSRRLDIGSVTSEMSRLLDEPIIEPGGEPPPAESQQGDEPAGPRTDQLLP